MKKLCIPAGILLLGGIVMMVLPFHIQMTGLVLILLGAALGLYGLLDSRVGDRGRSLLRVLLILASAGVIGLMTAMNLITDSGRSDWKAARKADYAIVLGAAVHENGQPSRIMRQRLNAAMEFMAENPRAVVILSGGQGPDESIPEADCMYNALLDMGADPKRLVREDQSHTTRENFINSMALMHRQGPKKPVAVITSEFHQRRARYIADGLGLETCAVSARTDQWFYRVNYTLREVFAFVKAAVQGRED